MHAGFDFGTSNCALGVADDMDTNHVNLISIDGTHVFAPSVVYLSPDADLSMKVLSGIDDSENRNQYMEDRKASLGRRRPKQTEDSLALVGHEAFRQYLANPGWGRFVRSPKSHLGSTALNPPVQEFLEDIVAFMMQSFKHQAEQSSGQTIESVVIGRPVQFQMSGSQQKNDLALSILRKCGERAGFRDIEFFLEPFAAAINLETRLPEEKVVLVVDIGGGTTDCVVVRMGPQHIAAQDREADLLGYSGERIGGNDIDIILTMQALMPQFGYQVPLKNGLPSPTHLYFDAAKTNDVAAQNRFYEREAAAQIERLLLETSDRERVQRFLELRRNRANHHLVRYAEDIKIRLSEDEKVRTSVDLINCSFNVELTQAAFVCALESIRTRVKSTVNEAIHQAGVKPEVLYLTGGSSQVSIFKDDIKEMFPDAEMVHGDTKGDIVSGLSRWAEKIYR